MKHKHYDLIVKWASDPDAWTVEALRWHDQEWIPMDLPHLYDWMEYRLIPKRKMMHLNGVEFPAPEREAPEDRTHLYVPAPLEEYLVLPFRWMNYDIDKILLKRGLVHLTREAAEAHAKAMLAAKEVEP